MSIVTRSSALFITLLTLSACGGDEENSSNTNSSPAGDMASHGDMADAGMSDGGDDMASGPECGDPTGQRPPQLSEHAGAFVPGAAGGTVVMFGGSLGIPENCGFPERTYETTTWLYDVACDSWQRLESEMNPSGRTRHTMVYDDEGDRVLLYGGLSAGGSLADVWALDMETLQWGQLLTNAGPAPARINHAAVYDPGGHRMLVFGGNTGPSVINIAPANDVWALNLTDNTWIDLTPPVEGPEPRLWVSALWDPDRAHMVIYGGGDDSAFTGDVRYFDDAWVWSDASGTPGWRQLDIGSTTRPPGRFWAGFTYDPVNERYVMFAGHDAGNIDGATLGNRNDTWFLDPTSGQWTEHLVGDIWNAPPNGFCDFPADFTTVERESPERRNAHIFVSGPTGAYAMGGKTDCGIVDDLVRFNFETDDWEVLTRATAGEVCLRKGGGDTCSGLCL